MCSKDSCRDRTFKGSMGYSTPQDAMHARCTASSHHVGINNTTECSMQPSTCRSLAAWAGIFWYQLLLSVDQTRAVLARPSSSAHYLLARATRNLQKEAEMMDVEKNQKKLQFISLSSARSALTSNSGLACYQVATRVSSTFICSVTLCVAFWG